MAVHSALLLINAAACVMSKHAILLPPHAAPFPIRLLLAIPESAKQVASTSFMVKVMPSKVPFRAVVCLDGNAWPAPEEAERAPAAGTGAAKAADSVGVRRSYPAGSVISGLHLRLFDQGGTELLVGKDSFEVRAIPSSRYSFFEVLKRKRRGIRSVVGSWSNVHFQSRQVVQIHTKFENTIQNGRPWRASRMLSVASSAFFVRRGGV